MIRNKIICIFAPFILDFEPNNGTNIRIKGYTQELESIGIKYYFYSTVQPSYVKQSHYIKCRISRKFEKLFLVYNTLYSYKCLRPITWCLKKILLKFSGLNKDIKFLDNNFIIWSHQGNVIPQFLKNEQNIEYLFDIHGLFSMQREYLDNLSLYRRMWFKIYEKHEDIVLRSVNYANVVSKEMYEVLHKRYPFTNFCLAQDGIPNDLKYYKKIQPLNDVFDKLLLDRNKGILLFSGSFKKLGGVYWLVDSYIKSARLQSEYELLLIGEGQCKEEILALIKTHGCTTVKILEPMSHEKLISLMKVSNIIICPDDPNNVYNQITPHIKLYDAVASGSKVLATNLKVNTDLFDPAIFNIDYFNYSNKDLEDKIFSLERNQKKPDCLYLTKLVPYTYAERCRTYINTYFYYD